MEKKNGEGKAGNYFERKKYIFCGGEEKRRKERRKTFGEGKYLFAEEKKNGEGKGGKHLEMENILL